MATNHVPNRVVPPRDGVSHAARNAHDRLAGGGRGVTGAPVALQRADCFVGRTTNWLYDHLRHLPVYRPVVVAGVLQNRTEFPLIEARLWPGQNLAARVWRRGTGRPYTPGELRWLARIAPRVLHSHFGYVAHGDHRFHQVLGVPWCVGFYGADVFMHRHQPEWQDRHAAIFAAATRALALGPFMADALAAMGCPRDKIVIHPLGVDTEDIPFAPRVYKSGAPLRVLFAGTFREKKGLIHLLEAMELLARRKVPVQLTVVGGSGGRADDERTEAEIRARLGRSEAGDAIALRSWLPFQSLMREALSHHVFVAPSIEASDGDMEGTPFVIQQMMLSAMPVVATRHSDIPFLFGPHADLLVAERDAAGIADALQRYAEEPSLVTIHGEQMRARMLGAFDVRACSADLARIYQEIAA